MNINFQSIPDGGRPIGHIQISITPPRIIRFRSNFV